MRRRDFIAVAAATAAFPRFAIAQQARKVPRVALVTGAIAVDQMYIGKDVNWSAFLEELESKGFVEGRTIVYDRYLTPDSSTENAQKIVATAPDAIFWGGAPNNAAAAMTSTKTIPMVGMTNDFVVAGLISNLARPDRNLTGVSTAGGPDTEGKMLSLLAEAVPEAKSVAYLNIGTNGQFLPIKEPYAQSARAAALKLGLSFVPIVYAGGGGEAEFRKSFEAMANKVKLAVFGSDTSLSATAQQRLVAKLALDARLPSIAPWNGFAIAGGLMSYGGNLPELARKAADYVR